jgi:acylphosphatase
MDAAIHIVVEGLVQGVGYRWFAARRAEALGLAGYVRNQYDGTVEVEAQGDRSMLESFLADLKTGPRSSQVRDMKIEWKPFRAGTYTRFEIR